ncbi:Major facilitator superfamily domain general substrate transporter [Penicillium concentricum]|uniref:Major facilitator superfamily domain general substrate transporter n=1 Tax=Penicillium concentricum TaxID=293559 RepID=A0A9W9SQX3_9EURO|nr:Major facilitator superfamily domain general substrate transporter [Penicillium concentricum]KAJ5382911.1 Major facilitator superfamily domain general substrate transporter [Penicillium concentricum]
MESVIRDAPFGQLVRLLTNNKYFQYPEEKPNFKLPDTWLQLLNSSGDGSDEKNITRQDSIRSDEYSEPLSRASTEASMQFTEARLEADEQHEIEKVKSIAIAPKKTKDGSILVDWYYTDDPENPHNWSNRKRVLITVLICLYTFVVYTTSAIYTSSTEGIMKEFGVSTLVATLGLSLYVLGYGIGPLVFSPLSEIPVIGRNPVYIVTMFLFVIISIPTAVVNNFAGLLVLRFLQGFFGSPCLASGGASIGDLYSLMSLPYAMMAWVSAAYCGPALGPLLSGFAVPIKGWRWSLFESIWASAPVFILMFMFLPETSSATILLRRADRLRKIHNTTRFQSQSEIDQRNMRISDVAIDALIKPMEITIKDPAVLFVQIYTAIIYGIYYSFFEVFPLVYPVDYNMNLGQVGLVFLCMLVACILGVAIYASYIYFWMNPRIRRFGFPQNEDLLIPALPASFGPMIGLFVFAWTARASIHWIAPTIGITIYGVTVFIVMQCIFMYIPLTYPKYAASLFAANDFFRSALACGSVLFAHPLFGNLGVARGVSLLGGLSVIGIIGIWLLYFYGSRLRALSKFAT